MTDIVLGDFDRMQAQMIWEDSVALADKLIPVIHKAAQGTAYELDPTHNNTEAMVARRTLALLIVASLMNPTVLHLDVLEKSLEAAKKVAADLIKLKMAKTQ